MTKGIKRRFNLTIIIPNHHTIEKLCEEIRSRKLHITANKPPRRKTFKK